VVDKWTSTNGRVSYLVRWTGYGPEWDEWLPLSRLGHCKELVAEFESRE
jgi:hypothetical protein